MTDISNRIRKPERPQHTATCIYARPGVGKTSLLGTMPGKGLVADVPVVEGGTYVLAPYADRVDVVEVTGWDQLQELYKFLSESKHGYAWVSVDTITATQQLAKRKVVKERDLSSDPHQISQQEWGKVGSLNTELVWKLRTLKMHVVLLAQEKTRADEFGGSREYIPDLSPASIGPLLQPMTLVGRLYTAEVSDGNRTVSERRLWTGPNSMYLTKVRAIPGRELPESIRKPNLGNIIGYLLGLDVPAPEGAEEGLLVAS